jgi:histone H3/H4
MEKNNKNDNILIKRKVQLLLKEKGIKANNNTIMEFDKYIKKTIKELLEIITYQLQLEGKKVIKENNVKKAIQKLKKETEYFEI